ncbi:MAG: hypothetical protein R3183_08435, partial [Oleiphilaceae bacterium]|nr:hypothetical protein [Oleiphilaceae bacterium]
MLFKCKQGNTKALSLALLMGSTVLVGCSDDDDSVQTGRLVDSAVAGIQYRTATQSGVTNRHGEFAYLAGETVTFSIGDINLPAVPAGAVITPLDLANADNPYH